MGTAVPTALATAWGQHGDSMGTALATPWVQHRYSMRYSIGTAWPTAWGTLPRAWLQH